MSEQPNYYPHLPPFKTLGKYLKTMRQNLQESLGETSGAVEIEVELLDRYERGVEAPSEEILLLLINHFGLPDDKAIELWELAGYDQESRNAPGERDNDNNHASDEAEPVRQAQAQLMLLALDARVLYANRTDIVADENGMVLNFSQPGDAKQPLFPVARIGMSYEQAERLAVALQNTLLHKKYLSGPKQLPAPEKKPKRDDIHGE